MDAIAEAVKQTKAYYCLDCGKCSSVCPISLLNENYTPRLLVKKAVMGDTEELLKDELLWSCLGCGLCDERCESGVAYTEFIRDVRIKAYELGREGVYAHGEALQSFMRIMAKGTLKQNRLDWVTEELKTSEKGEFLYFIGCLPYFDTLFKELDPNTLDIAKSTLKILNSLGIQPVLMENERCCGHDLLWTGDVENFKRLAEHNIKEIEKTGCEKVIVSCPECYVTLKRYYPEWVRSLNLEIIHISQLLAEEVSELGLKSLEKRVTYQDPCKLGRFSGVYEEPREIMAAIQGLQLSEMERNRNSSVCCGTSGWINCTTYSKQIQIGRLKEAKSTGANCLVTFCPKCKIHFTCAIKDSETPDEAKIEIEDLTTLVANQLNSKSKVRAEDDT